MSRLLIPVVLVSLVSGLCAEDGIFEGDGKPTLVLEHGAGEGPAWHPQLGLLFSGDGGINRLTPDGQLTVFRKQAGTNGLLFDSRRRLLACEPVRRRVSRTETDGTVTVLTSSFNGQPYNQPNDITVDGSGRIYFSDPKYGPRTDLKQVDSEGREIEGVYRIALNGEVTRIITHEVDRPNGLLVTANGRYFYVADNNNNDIGGARKLWRFDFNDHGEVDLSSRRLIFDWQDGRGPDGMVEDRMGRIYVAGGLNEPHPPAETTRFKGGVYVFDSTGEYLTMVPIPRDEVTNCSFGGEDLRTLFITAGGTLWSLRTTSPGSLPWARE
jgi:gluconolactonase